MCTCTFLLLIPITYVVIFLFVCCVTLYCFMYYLQKSVLCYYHLSFLFMRIETDNIAFECVYVCVHGY